METEHGNKSEAKKIAEIALKALDQALINYHNVPDSFTLLRNTQNTWKYLNSDESIKAALEQKIKEMKLATKDMNSLMGGAPNTTNKSDPIRGRIDPDLWMDYIPSYLKDSEGEYILERSKALVTLINGLDL